MPNASFGLELDTIASHGKWIFANASHAPTIEAAREASDVSSMHINNTGCRDGQRHVDGRPHCARRKQASQDSTAGIRREIWSN
jgi:hypothetical protein